MAFRSYQKIYAQKMSQSVYTWGGTNYSNILHLQGEAVPDAVSVAAYDQVTDKGSDSDLVICHDIKFVLPYPFDINSVIDGTVSGNVKVSVYGKSDTEGNVSSLRAIYVQLLAVDSTGVSRPLCAKTTIWSGDKTSMYEEIKTVSVMYWLNVNEQVRLDERVVLHVQTYGYVGKARLDSGWSRLYCGKNTDELSITLPFII